MLTRLLEYWLTPCPPALRRMGYLSEIIGIKARYRRCQAAWTPHLERTKAVIREGMQQCASRRKAIIIGSGMLLDVPLRDLSDAFREVILVDLIHPWSTRWERRPFPNVRLVSTDITNTVESVLNVRRPTKNLVLRGRPDFLRDDPEVDYVASVNLLSQLPFIPLGYLQRNEFIDDNIARDLAVGLIQDHLDYLQSFSCCVSLIADLRRIKLNGGTVVDDLSALHDFEFPWSGSEWDWELAPRPEAHRIYSHRRRVIGIPNIHLAEPRH